MTKREMEKKFAEYLDERYLITINPDSYESQQSEQIFYDGACAAIAQIGGWERNENGTHYVKLN